MKCACPRLSSWPRLTRVLPRPACLAIARDEEVGDEVRLSAAQLAALDPALEPSVTGRTSPAAPRE